MACIHYPTTCLTRLAFLPEGRGVEAVVGRDVGIAVDGDCDGLAVEGRSVGTNEGIVVVGTAVEGLALG